MASQEDVRRIALSLPGVTESSDRFAFSVESKGRQKGFVWVWMERVDPKKPRSPNPDVIAVRVRDQAEKAALIAGEPDLFFTEPHYDGFPAVLVRLPAIANAQLGTLIAEAWRSQASLELLDSAAPARPGRQRRGRGSAPRRLSGDPARSSRGSSGAAAPPPARRPGRRAGRPPSARRPRRA